MSADARVVTSGGVSVLGSVRHVVEKLMLSKILNSQYPDSIYYVVGINKVCSAVSVAVLTSNLRCGMRLPGSAVECLMSSRRSQSY